MKIAILSDIHGNLEALEAVLADLDRHDIDEVFCLGDMVGYGPDPEAVLAAVIDRGWTCLLGNHEAALSSPRERNRMNVLARENNAATRALLSPRSLSWCAALPRTVGRERARFVHGCPPDSLHQYLYNLSDAEIAAACRAITEQLCFVGHTHDLKLIAVGGEQVERTKLIPGRHVLPHGPTLLINVGSVGQPRDGTREAKYVIWDSGGATVEVRTLPYPARLTADKIIARGFPKAYAVCIL